MRIAAAIALAALLGGCAHFPHDAHYEIVGYYAGWKDPIAFDARDVTVVNYAFVDFAFKAESPAFARLAAMRQGNPRLRLMASIGGWTGSGPFSSMANAADSRAAFIDASLGFLRRRGFDGIDLDWEYPEFVPGTNGPVFVPGTNSNDKRNFIALAREMRAALDAAGQRDGKRLPFYGKSWKGCAPGPAGDGLYQPCEGFGSELMFPDVHRLANRPGFERRWNEPGRALSAELPH